eukprot:TRINITY_DN10013_c0_g1_i1.p1 TRINITY_DN10013_c0_g1~~TRINITY_DN10013_c0_g1_i1.p1  ORF type:complete len:994 (+),score=218.35 TRINITY_DN10013_c0_g1_i1:98-3079(+)
MAAWLKGTVKAVPSGDTLVVMSSAKGAPPPEKSITLANLMAPRLARRDGKDEPFAWDSREFLRKQYIGKEVLFKIDYVVATINREFATVFEDNTNVAFAVVGAGWAKVRPQTGQTSENSPYLAELQRLEEQAQTQGHGVWNKTAGASESSMRNIPPSAIGDSSSFDAMAFLQSNKGTPLKAVVEQVRDGSTVRVYLLPEFQFVQVYMAGIQAPSMGRRPATTEAVETSTKAVTGETARGESETPSAASDVPAPPLTSAQKLAASAAAAASTEVPPDPFAREAKHFTEVRVLHRDVRVVLEGVDKFSNLIGSVHYAAGDEASNLALELVQQGLAKVVEWSANMLEEGEKRKLKAAELQVKKDRVRMWVNYVPPASNSTAIQNVNFTGKVVEVVSGDCIVVADDAAPFGSAQAERRVNLSSIRAPKIGNPKRNEKPASYAREAKDCLRTRLIGQQVNVEMEYSRKVAPTDGPTLVPSSGGSDSRVMDFGSVFLVSATQGEEAETHQGNGHAQSVNVAEMILARGFGNVVRHRDFEERSAYYDALLAAEARATKGKKGIHSGKESPVMHINDLSLTTASHKAKQFLPFLQRARRLPAVVDYVLSGHRFKLIIPKETCAIAFSLSGVRCPGRGEPFAEDAIAFMRRRILQRDVEIEVETVDKTGTFLGSLWEAKTNVAVPLLEAGLAKLHPLFSADRTTEGQFLVLAEQKAKKQLLKVWEGYVEGESQVASAAPADGAQKQELVVRVTEVLGGGKFYVQTVSDTRTASIQQQLEALRVQDKPFGGFTPKRGEIVISQFSGDETWNRALIVNVPRENPTAPKAEYEVFYIDFGNQETVPFSKLRPLDGSVSTATGLAQLCSLAWIKVPELDENFGVDAAEYLCNTICNKTFTAIVEDKDTTGGKVKGQGTGSRLIVTLKSSDTNSSINADLLENGYARVEKKGRWDAKEKLTALDSLGEHQDIARKARLNIWEYGDVESDEEDQPSRRGAGSARGRGR